MKELFKKVKKLKFFSKSLENSEMNWNFFGEGNVEITEENNKIYFFEKIILNNGMEIFDKKIWEFEENKINFYRFRNEMYEKIFEFSKKDEKFVLEEKYRCFPDNYFGEIEILENEIKFTIKIVGKRKNEEIKYIYE